MTVFISADITTGDVVKHYFSEFIGTFGFVFIGLGSVVFAAPFIGYLGISMAFGLAYAAVCFAFPDGHFNPAATIAAALSGRFCAHSKIGTALRVSGYILAQMAGACAAAAVVYFVYSGKTGYVPQETAGANIINRYALSSAFYLEAVLMLLFLCVFLGTYENKSHQPIACGFFITAAYLISYPITKGALNPARTTAAALFGGEEALAQLPFFWEAALIASLIAGIIYNPQIGNIFRKKSS